MYIFHEVPQDFFEDDGTNFKINEKIKEDMKEFCSFIADQNPDNTKQKAKYAKKPGTNFVERRTRTVESTGRSFPAVKHSDLFILKDSRTKNGEAYKPTTSLLNKVFSGISMQRARQKICSRVIKIILPKSFKTQK